MLFRSVRADDAIVLGATAGGGFGFSATAHPVPLDLSVGELPSGVAIRTGDLVVSGGSVVTSIASVSSAGVRLTDPLVLTQPISTLTVYGLGWSSYKALTYALGRVEDAALLFDGTFPGAAARYGLGDVNQADYVKESSRVLAALDATIVALDAYQANRVVAVDALLAYLRDERYQGTRDALLDLDILTAFTSEAATQSHTSRASELLQTLSDALGGAGDGVVISTGERTNDYLDRPTPEIPLVVGAL